MPFYDDPSPLITYDSGLVYDAIEGGGGGKKGHMAEVALKLDEKTPDQIRTLMVNVEMGLTGNANFPAPSPAPAAFATKVTAYDGALTTRATALAALTTADDGVASAVEDMKQTLRDSKKDCEKVSKGDRVKLESANFPIKSDAQPVGDLPAPQNFSMTQGDHTGEADGHCDRVPGARAYKAEWATASGGPYTEGYNGTKSSFTIKNLALGAELWFHMAVLGPNGWSDWSDPAKCRII